MGEKKQENQLFAMVKTKQSDLWQIKAGFLKEKEEVYFKRALLTIAQDKNLLALTKTKPGAQSLFMCLSTALQMGLQIGGQIPQAYIVPMKDTATLIPTADGFKFIVLSDPPVLKSFVIRAVYEGEKFSLNYATGEVRHEIDMKTKRGELMGVYGMITELDGTKTAEYMPRGEIELIRDRHSVYFSKFKKGPWKDDFVMMCIKTAAKRFLKPYAALKEGLNIEAFLKEESDNGNNNNGDIQDRACSIVDDVIEADATVEMSAEAEKPENGNDKQPDFKFGDQPEDKF